MRRNLLFLASSIRVALILDFAMGGLSKVLPRLAWEGPLWVQLVGVFALAELFDWALHFAKHKNQFLWRLHCQHHRDDRYTVWLTTHTYAPEVLVSGLFMGSLLIINPAYHRHHHGFDQVNFGSTLSFWDWVFGTAAWPKDRHVAINPPPVEQSPEPFGFVEEMLYPLRPSRWVDSRRAE